MALMKKKAVFICLISVLICSILIRATEGKSKDAKHGKIKAAGAGAAAGALDGSDHPAEGADAVLDDKKCKKGVPESLCKAAMAGGSEDSDDDDDDDDDEDDDKIKVPQDKETPRAVVLGH